MYDLSRLCHWLVKHALAGMTQIAQKTGMGINSDMTQAFTPKLTPKPIPGPKPQTTLAREPNQ